MARITKEEKRGGIISAALKLFSQKGFYITTIPDIAQKVGMSVGNFYNYFASKELLAKELLMYIAEYLGKRIREINEKDISTEEKIYEIVSMYFTMADEKPEMIQYFLRVYLSNREVFGEGCEGMICVSPFVTEMMIFFEEGVAVNDLHNQDFFSAFGLFMGYLGGMVFLFGEKILPEPLEWYKTSISQNIYNALKTR
ncbi:TetR/AcrR family transcriptional regulator [Sulfurimonas sp. SAG-AH-194-L11]|nr:TetR/AcrR family transcriptional regulator [Sulfurimonas sp. SAG-AH-194-L11]MDF1877330.1 TetR/AcrR family transcriptional regulator [Sulfurimonas sp. SAG-AH-194-L11]